MSLTLLLYIADVVEKVSIISFILGMLSLPVFIIVADSKKYLGISLMFITIFCLLPSKTTMYAYGAETVVRDIASNPRVQALYDKSMKILEDKLDEIGKKNE